MQVQARGVQAHIDLARLEQVRQGLVDDLLGAAQESLAALRTPEGNHRQPVLHQAVGDPGQRMRGFVLAAVGQHVRIVGGARDVGGDALATLAERGRQGGIAGLDRAVDEDEFLAQRTLASADAFRRHVVEVGAGRDQALAENPEVADQRRLKGQVLPEAAQHLAVACGRRATLGNVVDIEDELT
ncbi:MAG TPA: hypothetical protein DDX04_03895 [Massilia sp.]|nr:hypothetical protein [Massilia sp.]